MTTSVSNRATVARILAGTLFAVSFLVMTAGADAAVHRAKRGRDVEAAGAGPAMSHPARPGREAVIRGELTIEAVRRARGQDGVIRVASSPGGSGAAAMELARGRVVIDGPCNSACAWSFISNERACFTRNASFGFHGAHDPGTSRRMPAATDYWLSQVRGPLRGELMPLRSSSTLITVSSGQMMQYYGDRACGTAGRHMVAAR